MRNSRSTQWLWNNRTCRCAFHEYTRFVAGDAFEPHAKFFANGDPDQSGVQISSITWPLPSRKLTCWVPKDSNA